jgi:CrcB protein
MLTLLVAIAAGVGAVARYVVDRAVTHRLGSFDTPWGTFVVNVSGSLLLGLVTGLALHHHTSADAVAVVGAGLTGGYTTLSTWAWETVALGDDGRRGAAAVNAVGALFASMGAGALGLWLATL